MVAGAEGVQHGVQVGDQLTDQLAAPGQGRRQRRGLCQHRGQRAALPLENTQQFTGQRIDLIGIQRSEQRAEAPDQRIDVQCGRCAGQRNRRTRRQPAGRPRALFEREVAVTDQVLVAHDSFGALGEPHPVVDCEADGDRAVAMQRQVADLADLHPGDADEVAGLQTGYVRENCLIGGSVLKAQLPEHRDQGKREQQAHRREERDTCPEFQGARPSSSAHGGGCPPR